MVNFEFIAQKNTSLAQFLSSCFNKKIISIEVESFADTESYIKFSDIKLIKNKNLCIIQQFSFLNKPLPRLWFTGKNDSCINPINEQFFKFLLLIDFLKKAGAKKIIAILPYLPYGRQDKSFYDRYVGPISVVGKFLKSSGINQVISFDLHEPSIKSDFALDLQEIDLVDFWAKFIRDKFVDEKKCIVSPDRGGMQRAEKISKILNVDFAYVEKKRIDSDKTIALRLKGKVKDKQIILVDDILDTGMTAINASKLLKEKGAKNIIGCFAHGIFANDVVQKLETSNFDKIFVTNTIKLRDDVLKSEKISVVSIDDLLCDYLKKSFNKLRMNGYGKF